ncbi:MAG: ADP-ribosyltransferase [Methanoregula sp.]|jgi:hypothetical protein
MVHRNHHWSLSLSVSAGIIALLILSAILSCGCLDIEPEEMPPLAASSVVTLTVSPTVPADTMVNTSSTPPPVAITSPKLTKLYTEYKFPADVEKAVSDFSRGETTDTINGYLRWESVRAKTSKEEKARIGQQVSRIDYALFNTTAQENITVYIGISGEQAKRIRNESVFSENGYIIASYDPSEIYHKMANSGRDSEGYLTMCVVDFRKGNHFLFVNATEKEFIIPRGSIWDVAGEVTYEKLEFSKDSIPHYDDIIPTKVRLIYTKEHP